MKAQILIVGGYGKVGSQIARLLNKQFDGGIIIAGRSLVKAKQLSDKLGSKVTPMQLDYTSRLNAEQLEGVSLVIMCSEQQDASFAKQVLELGIHYIDITASYSLIKQLENLQPIAVKHGAVGMLSVGLAPGLTNLMATHIARKAYEQGDIHISILLGAGEKHGDAAIQWILHQLNERYTLRHKGTIRNFTSRRKTHFTNIGHRSMYRFNFSDQHTLPLSLPGTSITTSLGFDVEWLNRMLAFLQWSRIGTVLKSRALRNMATKLIQRGSIGSSVCGVRVDIACDAESSYSLTFMGEDESYLTAYITSIVATQMIDNRQSGGMYHIEQYFKLDLDENVTSFTTIPIVPRI